MPVRTRRRSRRTASLRRRADGGSSRDTADKAPGRPGLFARVPEEEPVEVAAGRTGPCRALRGRAGSVLRLGLGDADSGDLPLRRYVGRRRPRGGGRRGDFRRGSGFGSRLRGHVSSIQGGRRAMAGPARGSGLRLPDRVDEGARGQLRPLPGGTWAAAGTAAPAEAPIMRPTFISRDRARLRAACDRLAALRESLDGWRRGRIQMLKLRLPRRWLSLTFSP